MPFQAKPVVLDEEQRAELEQISGSQSLPAGFVLRAKIVLLLADGWSYSHVVDKLDTSMSTVGKWKRRFLETGIGGLETERPGQAPPKLTPKLVRGFSTPNDPDFERKVADLLGLYLDPPQHAAVFCVDERQRFRR